MADTVLKAGARGPDVTRVQRAMNAAGGAHVTVNGVYGVATQSAVGQYQRRIGMASTKVVGSPTWRSLPTRTSLRSRAQTGLRPAPGLPAHW